MKHTPFHDLHVRAGGRMIDFGGWHMPVQYTGVIEEHHAVRNSVGLFDVSHMGEVEASGPEVNAFAQYLLSNDVNACAIDQAQYAVMCQPDGGIVDDLITYRLAPDHLLFCVNASNSDKDFAWMQEVAKGFDVTLVNKSADYAQLAIQGRNAEAILQRLTDLPLQAITYYHFKRGDVSGVPMIIARTGYTGEDGFEIFFSPEHAELIWNELHEKGKPEGLRPIGLGARDTLRLEMKYSLYGNDIDATTHPLDAGLGWVVKLNKPDFMGKAALVAAKSQGLTRKLVGFELLEKNVPRHGYRALDEAGNAVGVVTSGAVSPCLSKPIGIAYLPNALSTPGSRFAVEIRGKAVPAQVVKTPFYKPGKG